MSQGSSLFFWQTARQLTRHNNVTYMEVLPKSAHVLQAGRRDVRVNAEWTTATSRPGRLLHFSLPSRNIGTLSGHFGTEMLLDNWILGLPVIPHGASLVDFSVIYFWVAPHSRTLSELHRILGKSSEGDLIPCSLFSSSQHDPHFSIR